MPGQTSGLQRDLNLVRRRWWLFIPFLLFGVLVSFALGSVAGKANAVASMQLETVVHELFLGGDRGFRIFEAEAMTTDKEFRDKVIATIGDPDFDYARFNISLSPVSIADGVSRGTITVSVKDDSKSQAEKYRAAFVGVFETEYTAEDGLFRQRFVRKRQEVADQTAADFQEAYKKLKAAGDAQGISVDELFRFRKNIGTDPLDELNRQEGALVGELAEVQAALKTLGSGRYGGETASVLASAVLGVDVGGDPMAALQAREVELQEALASIRKQRAAMSDGAFEPGFLKLLDDVRGLDQLKEEAYGRLANARAAVVSAESTVDTTYTFSGGLAGTMLGRVAVVLAVTIVFGLIAIYTLEWLSQVRAGTQE